MRYAIIENSTVIEYPVVPQDRCVNTSFPTTDWPGGWAEGMEFVVVAECEPVYDAATQSCEEATPRHVDGAWVQQWTISDLSPEVLAERRAAELNAITIPALEGKEALLRLGAYADVDELAKSPATALRHRLAWESATTWRRGCEAANVLLHGIGWDDAQIDSFFQDVAETVR